MIKTLVITTNFVPLRPKVFELFADVGIPKRADHEASKAEICETNREKHAHGGEMEQVFLLRGNTVRWKLKTRKSLN